MKKQEKYNSRQIFFEELSLRFYVRYKLAGVDEEEASLQFCVEESRNRVNVPWGRGQGWSPEGG